MKQSDKPGHPEPGRSRPSRTRGFIALIDNAEIIERILRHLDRWDPTPDALGSTGPNPPVPEGETLPLTYHPVPDIA